MKLHSLWTRLVCIFDVLTFSPVDREVPQLPLVQGDSSNVPHELTTIPQDVKAEVSYVEDNGDPVVVTPKNPQEGEAGGLNCSYPGYTGWEPCYGPKNRGCWLRKTDGSETIDIKTDYENPTQVPNGTVRNYYLELGEEPISPDGATMEHGKIFNRTYPGPWIEACWGDTLNITVKNNLRWNGTSVHWHGIRQLNTNGQDGVNGITQCPIPPGESYTYTFKAYQYGSAWYHSHYSLQYGDGALGPLTIYGPSTSNFSEQQAFRPLLMTDWNHRSVFEDWPVALKKKGAPYMTNILLNGTGQFSPDWVPEKYSVNLGQGKQHMMILINTAVDTTFVFSIDNHELEVVEMDFVPIKPYFTNHIKVGIGQRYHVIVHGLERPYEIERFGNYWMRVVPARKCSKFLFGPDHQMGIVRYNASDPKPKSPLSDPPLYDINCADEPYENLKPWRPWTVGNPVNIDRTKNHSDLANSSKYIFDVHMRETGGPGSGTPYIPDDKAYNRWMMHNAPFRINFSDPTVLALEREDKLIDQPHLDIVTYDNRTQEHPENKWIWMIITAPDKVPPPRGSDKKGFFVTAAHPMHLHGHDFAILAQSNRSFYDQGERLGDRHSLTPEQLNCNNTLIECNNPPRRDVALLPAAGYLVIAFKADNPGVWIMHCHIALHASSGLAMQIIENKDLIEGFANTTQNQETCKKWNEWYDEPMNLWDWHKPSHFQDDSGV